MYLRLCLLGVLAAVGCEGASSPAPAPGAANNTAKPAPAFAILVPNMT